MADEQRNEAVRVLRYYYGQTVVIPGPLLDDLAEAFKPVEHVHHWEPVDGYSSMRKCGCGEVGWYIKGEKVEGAQ